MSGMPGKVWFRVTLPLVVTVALVVAAHVWVVAPRARETRALRRRALALQVEQASMAQGTRDLTQWLRAAAANGPDASAGDTVGLASAVPALLQKVSELSGQHGIRVLAVRPEAPGAPIQAVGPDGSPQSYVRLPVHFTVVARFQDLGGFLEDLDREGGLAEVSRVQLSLNRDLRALTVDMTVDAFGRLPQ